jgi:hypothetical protein
MINFDKVIISDTVTENLIGQASKEGLLAAGADPQLEELSRRRSIDVQDALALLVLFDHLFVPDFSNSFHIPELEDVGLITFLSTESLPHQIASLRSDAEPEQTAAAFEESLDLAEALRPLVLNRVIFDLEPNSLWSILAQYLHTTEYEVCSAALDYIKAFYYHSEMPESNLLVRGLPNDIRQTIDADLGGQHKGMVGPAQLLFSSIVLSTHEIVKLHELTDQYGAGIATKKYTGLNADFVAADVSIKDPLYLTRGFHLLRCALHEEMRYFPRVDSIEHALYLRKDANLQSFKEQIRLFHQHLALGDTEAAVKLAVEVRNARKALATIDTWSAALNWATYISLPVSIIEPLLLGAPLLSLPITILSIATTIGVERARTKNEWVLFGR